MIGSFFTSALLLQSAIHICYPRGAGGRGACAIKPESSQPKAPHKGGWRIICRGVRGGAARLPQVKGFDFLVHLPSQESQARTCIFR